MTAAGATPDDSPATMRLATLVLGFRSAVDKHIAAGGDVGPFPNGACTEMSWLLTRWLMNKGYRNITYCQGASPLIQHSHGWLEVDSIVVDITADQFGRPPVIVTRHSDFHSSFPNPERLDATIEVTKFHHEASQRQARILRELDPYLPMSEHTLSN